MSARKQMVVDWLEGHLKGMRSRLPALEKKANLENFDPTFEEENAAEEAWILENTVVKFEDVIDYLKGE
jgi:hypothetical protein